MFTEHKYSFLNSFWVRFLMAPVRCCSGFVFYFSEAGSEINCMDIVYIGFSTIPYVHRLHGHNKIVHLPTSPPLVDSPVVP